MGRAQVPASASATACALKPSSRRPRTSAKLRSVLLLAALVLGAFAAMQGLQAWSRARLGPQVAAAAKPGDIFMIASVSCVYCAAARAWFDANRVPFTECLIERDAACKATFDAAQAPGTPLMVVRGKLLLGFNPERLRDALRPAG